MVPILSDSLKALSYAGRLEPGKAPSDKWQGLCAWQFDPENDVAYTQQRELTER